MTIYKHVIHFAKTAHLHYFISVCGIRLNYPIVEGALIITYEQCDEEGIPRKVGTLQETTCKACQRTWIYKQKLKNLIVPKLMGEHK